MRSYSGAIYVVHWKHGTASNMLSTRRAFPHVDTTILTVEHIAITVLFVAQPKVERGVQGSSVRPA